ncbi:hypothetical protein [Streptomyces sp. SID3343]|uniref:hypothetical protein n=1 Tax=Streptomyces sp. SID3343 TaxID=2690260 RepID=UPI0013711A30|nr:hypothetical protein [Streptomyces sp. SID3343]MYV98452.1 hypothetical protein [Streptomyces sp. SID3343]
MAVVAGGIDDGVPVHCVQARHLDLVTCGGAERGECIHGQDPGGRRVPIAPTFRGRERAADFSQR